jgi:tetratricopeptide (TPR) repeat protein
MRRLMLMLAAAVALGALAMLPARADTVGNPDPSRYNLNFASDPAGAMLAARERVAAGDLDGAIRGLAIYVAAHPKEADPTRLLGDLYFRAGDMAKSEATYRAILAIDPKDKVTHNRLGTVLAAQNRVDDAIEEFNASLPGTDSVPDLVALHQRKGDLAKYRSNIEQLSNTYPNDADIQSELGQLYESMHRPSDAVRMFRRALDSAPTSLTALNGLGLALMDLHEYDLATAEFTQCRGQDPQYYPCLDNIGAAYLEMGRYADAEQVLTVAHNLDPELPEALVNFGYLADARNDWKTAVGWYLKALSMSPFSRDAYINLGITYREHQLYPQAEAVLIKGIAVAPDDGRLHELLGETYQTLGRTDLAIEQFRAAATSLDPSVATIAREHFAKLEPKALSTP